MICSLKISGYIVVYFALWNMDRKFDVISYQVWIFFWILIAIFLQVINAQIFKWISLYIFLKLCSKHIVWGLHNSKAVQVPSFVLLKKYSKCILKCMLISYQSNIKQIMTRPHSVKIDIICNVLQYGSYCIFSFIIVDKLSW